MHLRQASKESIREAYTKEEALQLDGSDTLRHIRSEFIIPTKDDLRRKTLSSQAAYTGAQENLCIYLCGNSLGLQPHRTTHYISDYMKAWATKGVFGHFKAHQDSTIPAFVNIDDVAAQQMAPIVGALANEVAVMETLSANLHLMMASFYRPTEERYKILLEGKAFPSDQVSHRGLNVFTLANFRPVCR